MRAAMVGLGLVACGPTVVPDGPVAWTQVEAASSGALPPGKVAEDCTTVQATLIQSTKQAQSAAKRVLPGAAWREDLDWSRQSQVAVWRSKCAGPPVNLSVTGARREKGVLVVTVAASTGVGEAAEGRPYALGIVDGAAFTGVTVERSDSTGR